MNAQREYPDFGMQVALKGLRDRGYRPSIVYDVGAADGSWTRMALQIWPQSSFICFEPLIERQEALKCLSADNPRQVIVEPCGIADADGELSLGVTNFLWDSSFAYPGDRAARKAPVRTLDSLHREGRISPPSFIKIDVQGFERRVLEGARSLLPGTSFILMECNFFPFCKEMSTLDETIAFMSSRGFIPYEFVGFLRRPLDGAMGQCDLLFVKRDHQLMKDCRWTA